MDLSILINHAPNTIKWLIFQAKSILLPPALTNKFMENLNKDGFSILRSNTRLNSIHPQVEGINYRWKRKEVNEIIPLDDLKVNTNIYDYKKGIVTELFWGYGVRDQPVYKMSPWPDVVEKGLTLRRHINQDETDFEFSIYKDFQELGVTDYLAFPIDLRSGIRNSMSLATDKSAGFTDEEVDIIIELSCLFMLHLASYQERQITKTLLSTYLGSKTGERVLEGKIRRGDVEKIKAAIWFSDLRGFSNLSNQIEPEELIELLNEYFETIANIIDQYGGEVLKFIGDAVLAIFPITVSSTSTDVCRNALQAAQKANSKLEILNLSRSKQQLHLLNHGIGLHLGIVQYGNIGAFNRLDFTVIGQAVNLTSRLEGLCGRLGKRTITSETFANNLEKEDLAYLGEYELKGFSKPQKIFSLYE